YTLTAMPPARGLRKPCSTAFLFHLYCCRAGLTADEKDSRGSSCGRYHSIASRAQGTRQTDSVHCRRPATCGLRRCARRLVKPEIFRFPFVSPCWLFSLPASLALPFSALLAARMEFTIDVLQPVQC